MKGNGNNSWNVRKQVDRSMQEKQLRCARATAVYIVF